MSPLRDYIPRYMSCNHMTKMISKAILIFLKVVRSWSQNLNQLVTRSIHTDIK